MRICILSFCVVMLDSVEQKMWLKEHRAIVLSLSPPLIDHIIAANSFPLTFIFLPYKSGGTVIGLDRFLALSKSKTPLLYEQCPPFLFPCACLEDVT